MNSRTAGAALLAAVVMLPVGCRQEETVAPVRPVRAMRAGDASQFEGRVFPGKAKATQEVNVSFRVDGPLVTRPIDVGDVVEAGDVLAQIDPRDFEVRLRNVQAQLEQARASHRLATEEHERAQEAFDKGAVTELEVSRRREREEAAKARVDSLLATVDAADDALRYTTLVAPFDGAVAAIYVENFEDIQAKQPIARILDDSRIEMVIEIPEQLIHLASTVGDITCTFDTFPGQPISATIKEIGTESSETTRTYPLTLIMDQPEGFRILPGMTGEARGHPDRSQLETSGLQLPLAAVASTAGEMSHVWVIDEASGTVRKREVILGALTATGIMVEGVERGEWIATAGVHYLREGQRVTIYDRLVGEAGP